MGSRALAASSSILLNPSLYRRIDERTYRFLGERPGPDWHAHGTFSVAIKVIDCARARVISLIKPRWKHKTTGVTTHSAPNDIFGIGADPLVAAVLVGSSLDRGGNRVATRPFAGLAGNPSRRTLQRWTRTMLRRVSIIEDAVREVVRRKCEPRPWESLFPLGLPPPTTVGGSLRTSVALWRLRATLALVFRVSKAFVIPTATLLAEARGREFISQAHR
jgi:hypothetical protein